MPYPFALCMEDLDPASGTPSSDNPKPSASVPDRPKPASKPPGPPIEVRDSPPRAD